MHTYTLALLLSVCTCMSIVGADDILRPENRFAWCIVPFDAAKRTPAQRAAMLKTLGIPALAYDWRAEHIPTFEAEINACKEHDIAITAWWFPGQLDATAQTILALLKKHHLHTQLWVMQNGAQGADDNEKIAHEVQRIKPLAEAAAAIECTVGLYNHGGWFGDPRRQIAVVKALQQDQIANVGIVYNQHHGHAHIDEFATLLAEMKPYLFALNLNGMEKDGDKHGHKIMPIGQGDQDIALMRIIRDSAWQGPIGILNHTDEDAQARLQDNSNGLNWVISQLDGTSGEPRPMPISWKR